MVVALLLTAGAMIARAQLPNASAAAHGMGGNFTAIARGYEAIAWNPANLGMPGRPGFSLGLGILGGSVGLDPVDVKMLHGFSGRVVDTLTANEWVGLARLAGGQKGRLDGGITPLALSIGPVGIQLGGSAYTNLNLSPDAWEAMLRGNDRNGTPKPLDLTGTSVRVGAISAAAMSFAFPLPINLTNGLLRNERAAIGITAKYVMGNGLAIAQDFGSSLTDSLQLRFPMIRPDSNFNMSLGNGVGADLGMAWSGGPWRVGLNAENVFNTFKWDTTALVAVSGEGTFSADTNSTDFETEYPFSAAPAELKDIVRQQAFKPAITLGAAFRVLSSLTLTADLKQSLGGDEAIVIGPKSRFGVGAEWRVLPFLPLRAGVASVTDGWQAGAGFGLRFLGYEFGASTSIRRRGESSESGLMIGVLGIGR
jgi:hypothetical protein